MKFVLDACVSSLSLKNFLERSGHDVASVLDVDPRLSDEKLMEWGLREKRTLITKDKDFGELVFVRHLPHPTIVRLVEMAGEEEIAALQELIGRYSEELEKRSIIVVTKDRIRIRRDLQP